MYSFEPFALTVAHYLWQFLEIAVFGFFIAGVLQAVIRPGALQRLVGGGVLRANAMASVVGFFTPLCCCTSIPTAIELYRSTGRKGPASAFLIATPWFNWYALIALTIFLGWQFAIAVAFCGILIGIITGCAVDFLGHSEPQSAPELKVNDCEDEGCCLSCGSVPEQNIGPWLDLSNPGQKIKQALQTALELLRELAPWIVAGALLGAAVKQFLPDSWVLHYGATSSLVGLLLLAGIASILYTDSLGSLPWIHALQTKGLASGNAMLLLIGGVGTNVATLGPVSRFMGRQVAVVYATGVILSALLLAAALNQIF